MVQKRHSEEADVEKFDEVEKAMSSANVYGVVTSLSPVPVKYLLQRDS